MTISIWKGYKNILHDLFSISVPAPSGRVKKLHSLYQSRYPNKKL